MEKPQHLIISDAQESDLPHIQGIYAPYVLNTTVSLEETPPSVEEMKTRWQESLAKDLPFIVAKNNNIVAGYAYAFPYRTRSGYRFTVEESIYIADGFKGVGIGRQLLNALITRCREKGYKQMLAIIAGSDNAASLKFHESLRFKLSGTLHQVGFKFGQWVDTIVMQREL